jgi:hypothetical protein
LRQMASKSKGSGRVILSFGDGIRAAPRAIG